MDPTMSNATAVTDMSWFLRAKGPVVCSSVRRYSRGIWYGDDLIVEVFPMYLLQFVIMNLLLHTLRFLLRPLKQSKIVCCFMAGLIMSPTVMGRVEFFRRILIRREELLLTNTIGYLGALYVIFVLAVKTDVRVVARNFRKASVVGFSGVFGSFLALIVAGFILELPGVKKDFFRLLFAMGMSATRFPSVAQTFDEMNIMSSELGQLAVSCTMISELLGWSVYLIGLYLRSPANRGYRVLYALAVPILSYVGFRPGITYMARKSPEGLPVKEKYIMMILLGSLVAGFMCDLVGSMQLGFLVIGLMVPNGPALGATLVEKTELVVTELLFPIYFVSIGYNLDLSLLEFKPTVEIFVTIVLAALAKLAACTLSAYFICSMRFGDSVLLGLMLVIKGAYDLTLYRRWASATEITKQFFTVLAISEVIVTAIVTPLIEIFYSPHVRLSGPAGKNARFFITTSPNSELKILCCIHGKDDVPGVISLLEASIPTTDSPICAHVLHLNELIGQATPDISPYDRQLRHLAHRSAHIMKMFNNYSMVSRGTVRLRPYTVISAFKSMHEYICRLALQEYIPLIILPFRAELTVIRSINTNVQAYSPCTVGLLFSKGVHRLSKAVNHLTNVAIVFNTGNDDREALALGIRMTGHPQLKVTLIHVIVEGWECKSVEEKAEKKLDNLLVHQFVAERGRNERVGYHQFAVENLEQVMRRLRDLGGGYDLIIVGRKRRRTIDSMDEETMRGWSDNPELGVLGDLIASAEYLSDASVLVMQHLGDVYCEARKKSKEDDAIHLLKLNS